jgi:hypothetical protein
MYELSSISLQRVLVISCLIAFPLSAQMGTVTKKRPMMKRPESTSAPSKVSSDATRLAAILLDVQNDKVTVSNEALQKTTNEARWLANRIATNAGGRKDARELRTHVNQMHDEAMKGNAAGARAHAGMAIKYANKLAD